MQACKVAQTLAVLTEPSGRDQQFSNCALRPYLLICLGPVKTPCAGLGDVYGLWSLFARSCLNRVLCLLTWAEIQEAGELLLVCILYHQTTISKYPAAMTEGWTPRTYDQLPTHSRHSIERLLGGKLRLDGRAFSLELLP